MKKGFTTIQIIFLASMIAMDFAMGMVIKNVLSPTGVFDIVRIDLIVPVMLMMLCRMMIDRFGTLILFETMWGMMAVIALPESYGLPGLLKLVPAVIKGFIYDSLLSLFRSMPRIRIYLSAIIGGIAASLIRMLLRVAMGLPWATMTKLLLGIQTLTSVFVSIAGAYLAIMVWKRISHTHLVLRIGADHD